ncbi:glr2305 [Gloeobacter violaceus PCC 7421]|uniref:Glr2305 protein n=1 Tax=Gloeobacter violaceus (strain ATCC 29082 / PCC 7421) TaxID=251221 RepID=Q7NI78_GLOVI|nr:glr2305 [Gloeobacter violaceus PCC 7421]
MYATSNRLESSEDYSNRQSRGWIGQAREQTRNQTRALVEELAATHRWIGLVHERISRSRAHTIGRIVEAVIGLVDRAGYCWASAETIAGYAGCDRSTVFRLWPEIEFAGLLVSVRQAHGPNRVYLDAALIDRVLALDTPRWAANPTSPFWLRYRQWLGQSIAYRHSRAALEPSALKSRLNLTPNYLEDSDQQIQRSKGLAEPRAFPPQAADDTTATPTGKGALRPPLCSGPCPPSLGRETEKLSEGGMSLTQTAARQSNHNHPKQSSPPAGRECPRRCRPCSTAGQRWPRASTSAVCAIWSPSATRCDASTRCWRWPTPNPPGRSGVGLQPGSFGRFEGRET